MTIAEHTGIVTKVGNGEVTVQIEAQSACSSCEAHGKCGFAESKAKEITIRTKDWQNYNSGDRVPSASTKVWAFKPRPLPTYCLAH